MVYDLLIDNLYYIENSLTYCIRLLGTILIDQILIHALECFEIISNYHPIVQQFLLFEFNNSTPYKKRLNNCLYQQDWRYNNSTRGVEEWIQYHYIPIYVSFPDFQLDVKISHSNVSPAYEILIHLLVLYQL